MLKRRSPAQKSTALVHTTTSTFRTVSIQTHGKHFKMDVQEPVKHNSCHILHHEISSVLSPQYGCVTFFNTLYNNFIITSQPLDNNECAIKAVPECEQECGPLGSIS